MTHIHTEVPEDEYERLRAIADERGMSIREALREATALWIERRDAIDTADPLFDSVESVRKATTDRDSEATRIPNEGDLVEEWNGDAEAYRLKDPE